MKCSEPMRLIQEKIYTTVTDAARCWHGVDASWKTKDVVVGRTATRLYSNLQSNVTIPIKRNIQRQMRNKSSRKT